MKTHTTTTGSTKYTTTRACQCSNGEPKLFTAYCLRARSGLPGFRTHCDDCQRAIARARDRKKAVSAQREFDPSNNVWYYVSDGNRRSRKIYDIARAYRALNLLAVFLGPRGWLGVSCDGKKTVIYSLRKERMR